MPQLWHAPHRTDSYSGYLVTQWGQGRMEGDPKARLAEIKARLADLKQEREALQAERQELRAALGLEPRRREGDESGKRGN